VKIKVPSHIKTLVPYPPGKPIEELEREYGITGSVKLASNENPWGPSPMAVTAIGEVLANLHRYPDGSCYYLARKLAAQLGVQPSEIVFGNGSNEIIGLLVSAFLEPGDEVITSHPTFLMYQKIVQVQGGTNRVVPLKDMNHDLEAILAAINDKTRLIFLDNPNNPTGSVIAKESFASFLKEVPDQVIVVLDEAYVDFVRPEEHLATLDLIHASKAVVGLRTFSKAYGLAGLRIGYGIMSEELAGFLHRVRQPFNVNSLAQAGALAALDDEDHYRRTLEQTRQGMAWLVKEVKKLGCRPSPSSTNFFLIDVGGSGKNLYERMLLKGAIVRPMHAYGYPNHIRITVGREEENLRFVKALSESLQELHYV